MTTMPDVPSPAPALPGAGKHAVQASEGLAAVGIMSTAMLFIPLMDITAKFLSDFMSPVQVTFGRFFFQLLVCLGVSSVTGQIAALKSNRPAINFLRGALLTLASLIFFTAVKFMSVATALSIFFVEPMILTILAAVVLKEPFGARRLVAIMVGMAGALLILRPSFLAVGPAALLPLGTALCFACYLLLNRKYAGSDGLLAIQFSTGLAGTLILGTLMIIGAIFGLEDLAFTLPSLPNLGLMVLMGVISFFGHGLVVLAFQKGEAGVLAPLQYLEIVSATLLGYLVFNHFPDGLTWMGIALIVSGGIYIAHRERQLLKAA